MAKLAIASVLAFERKLANSDALMYSGRWEEIENHSRWTPIAIQQKDVRGTISNRMKANIANDPAKLNAEIEKANLQRVDVAALPFEDDTLKVSFTLRVLGDLHIPSACNSPEYQQALENTIKGYAETQTFAELAQRYAENIANGRFLWRNRVGAEGIKVQVTHKQDDQVTTWEFDSYDFNLRKFSEPSEDLQALTRVIENGLSGESYAFVTINAFIKLGDGQEVFPSQELILDKGKSDKSKVLYQVGGVAALHSQKVGNALRTIDTWHPKSDEVGPIAVEPYGSVTSRGVAYRQPKPADKNTPAKMDFYNLLDDWIGKDQAPDVEQQHYVMAMFIRGGVFGKAD